MPLLVFSTNNPPQSIILHSKSLAIVGVFHQQST
jgi:hypothetical protein